MRINNVQMIIPQYEEEIIEGELIMYSQQNRKIVVFNKTASLIWSMIKESYERNEDLNTDILCNAIIKAFNLPSLLKQQVYEDTKDIINQFLSEKILIKEK